MDNPSRDLAGMVLLGSEIARSEADVLLVPMNLRKLELSALDLDLVLINYVRKANQDFVRQLLATGTDVALLDTEGGVGIIGSYANIHDHYGNVMADDPSVRGALQFVCCWGPEVAAYMVKKNWYRADQVAITGAPRFDWYHEDLRQAALLASESVDEMADRCVLVIGSFPAANPQFRSAEEEMATRSKLTGYDRATVDELRDRDVVAMKATTSLLRELAGENPSTRFVYRPHPFERLETYLSEFSDLPNVTVSRSGTIDGWLLRCQAVIVPNDCTVAIEGVMAGVPVLVTDWIVPENRVDVVVQAGQECGSAESVRAALADILAGRWSPKDGHRAAEVIERWFHLPDGRAHKRVAEQLTAHARVGVRMERKRRELHYHRPDTPAWSSRGIQDRARSLLRLPARFSFRRLKTREALRWDQTPKAFGVADLVPFVDALNNQYHREGLALSVRPATPVLDYDYGYQGRSLVLEVADHSSNRHQPEASTARS